MQLSHDCIGIGWVYISGPGTPYSQSAPPQDRKKGNHHTQSPGTVPDSHAILNRRVSQNSPNSSRAFSISVSQPRPCFPCLSCLVVCQNLFEVDQKSFSMAGLSFSHIQVFASMTTAAVVLLACQYLLAESGDPQVNRTQKASFFHLTASLTAGVHQRILGLPTR